MIFLKIESIEIDPLPENVESYKIKIINIDLCIINTYV